MDVELKRRRLSNRAAIDAPRVLLVGPYDPHCGEFTFLAPPLGVWRIQGFLEARAVHTQVFDPNLRPERVHEEFDQLLRSGTWDLIGISTTGMTLQYDLGLAHAARAACPDALMIAGGMEATFNPQLMFEKGPFDVIVSGEGEQPLLELSARLRRGESLEGISGTVVVRRDGQLQAFTAKAMDTPALTEAIFAIPYDKMPYEDYWRRLETSYGVGNLPYKAQREARLAEIRSVRLITLNYCPMGCTFCSSTNFLHHAQGSIASIARLSAGDCILMMEKIVAAHPTVRTIIFQDDIFVFTNDKRVLPLCEAIVAAKACGRLPEQLQFISTNRIDSMTTERLTAMRRAGFRVLGFGVENFSRNVLDEFNKKHIHRHIAPALADALELGITPFLDLILTSPRSKLGDLAETVRQAYYWIVAGCEVGIYPYVIPFSGAAMSNDPELRVQTLFERRQVPGTAITWQQPTKILPLDPLTRHAILQIERNVKSALEQSEQRHLPSRTRSLLWIKHAIPVLRGLGLEMPDETSVALHIQGARQTTEAESCAVI
jgi:radical SAM superfamily enzyme YgiQ (UPF0313 family)